jgi:mRNA interferase MazF
VAVKRGEVWLADLSPSRGAEQAGTRPVLIVQTDRANPTSPHTIIVPFTTKIRRVQLPSHVLIKAGQGGLKADSVLLCEQIRVIDTQRLIKRLSSLSPKKMREVDQALRAILEL